jgi:protein-disulfide isomerase
MSKMWLLVAAVALFAPTFAVPQAHAEDQAPQLQPDDRMIGKPDAPGIIFEYASLTCPHCARFEAEVLPQVKSLWIDTGKAKLVFRDFPLDQSALRAAELAHCAPPDRYFAFLDILFKNQASWATSTNVKDALGRIARIGGIGEDKFNACMTDEKLSNQIVGMRLQAEQQYGVDSTPTFFVNGKKLVGEQPLQEIAEALGEKLPDGAKATPVAPGASSSAAKPAPDAKPTPAPDSPHSMLERVRQALAGLFRHT